MTEQAKTHGRRSSEIVRAPQRADVFVVIRAAGERTEEACRRLAEEQVGAENVVVLHERPFSRAVTRTLEVGMDAGREWTLLLDADVLVQPELRRLLDTALANQPEDVFVIGGRVFCKYHGGTIFAGIRAVRTALMGRAVAAAAQGPDSLAPETAIAEAMRQAGYGTIHLPDVWGIHDHEQSYRHIFLKMALRARKRPRQAAYLLARAESLSADMPDYRVAAWGLRVGIAMAGEAGAAKEYDWERDFPEFEMMLKEAGLSPKSPLDVERALRLPEEILSAQSIRTTGDLLLEFERRTGRINTSRGLLARVGRRLLAWDEKLRKRT